MNASELLFGTYGRLYAGSGAAVLLIVMLIMSVRLFAGRKRKAYVSLMLALLAFTLHTVLAIIHSLAAPSIAAIALLAQTMLATAFLAINHAIYLLYNSTNKRHSLYFYGPLFAIMLIAAFQANVSRLIDAAPEQLAELESIGLDLFTLLLVFVCYAILPQRVGQSLTYRIGLIAFFTAHLAGLVNRYMLNEPAIALIAAELYVPIVYYLSLFFLLLERTVELVQASYRTAITDGLTGLYNRRYMQTRIAQYMRHDYKVSLLFCDIDNFKQLNDTRGHQAGDEALRATARILAEESEEIGMAGRYGGEELIVLVTDPSVKLPGFAETIRSRVEKEAGVTVSIGYSTARKGSSAERLLKEADQAMYEAKAMGKNRAVKFNARKTDKTLT